MPEIPSLRISTFRLSDLEEKSRLATVLFLASESAFFLFLIVAYAYYNYGLEHGPTAASALHPLRAGIYSIALLASSVTLWTGLRQLRRGKPRSFQGWVLATILLAAVFFVGQSREYLGLVRINVTVSRNVFGTSFFTLTGFHAIHVLIGVILLFILFWLGPLATRPERMAAVESISYYWHFVDAVWIVIFSLVYLWTAHVL